MTAPTRARPAPVANVYPLAVALGLVLAAGLTVGLMWSLSNTAFDLWGGFFLAPILGVPTYLVIRRQARRAGDVFLARIIGPALILKLAGTFARYYVVQVVYNRVADATQYHARGIELSKQLRAFDFDFELAGGLGTGMMRLLTGGVYTLIGPTRLGGFVFFSWLGFLGLYFFYRAFREAAPDGRHRRYGALLFLLPSMLFWPSSIGKESWMLLGLGIAAFGAARALRGGAHGFAWLATGVLTAMLIRPHVALGVAAAVTVAYVVHRPLRRTSITPVAKLFVIASLLAGSAMLVARVETFFHVDDFDLEAVNNLRSGLESSTPGDSEDASNFDAVTATSPAQLPLATLTVLFRPLPQEANSPVMFAAAAENTALLLLTLLSLRRIVGALRGGREQPYAMLAATFVLFFVVAFSSFGNFGLLSRQRVQVIPFVLALACAQPPTGPTARQRRLAAAAPGYGAFPVATYSGGSDGGDRSPGAVPARPEWSE